MAEDSSFSISLEEMGEFDGCLTAIMGLAHRWGIIDIPSDQQICIVGLVMKDETLVERGMVFMMPRLPNEPSWILADSEISDCSVLFAVEILIDIIEQQLEARYKKSIPTWGDGC